jgi:hypothetical protein
MTTTSSTNPSSYQSLQRRTIGIKYLWTMTLVIFLTNKLLVLFGHFRDEIKQRIDKLESNASNFAHKLQINYPEQQKIPIPESN